MRRHACVRVPARGVGERLTDLAKPLCAQRLDHVEDSLQHGHVQIAEILSAAHTRHRTKAFSFQPCSVGEQPRPEGSRWQLERPSEQARSSTIS